MVTTAFFLGSYFLLCESMAKKSLLLSVSVMHDQYFEYRKSCVKPLGEGGGGAYLISDLMNCISNV